MQTIGTTAALRGIVAEWRAQRQRIAFVPTMGHLHEGHLSLVRVAREHGSRVVVSIFVNPLQFGAVEDFDGYRRTMDEDSARLRQAGVDLLFAPAENDMYPHGRERVTQVEVPVLSDRLCGQFRPGHFRGVATVVAKLFNLVQPDVAIFGAKDYQQLLVIRRMTDDLDFPIAIIGAPTIRDTDGLAMSSRNSYLLPAERRRAPALYAALCEARDRLRNGEREYAAIEAAALTSLREAQFRPEYFAIRRATDLETPASGDKNLAILVAAWLGRARLIDNLCLQLPR